MRRRAVTSILASEVVSDVAQRLERPGIDIMPVKGALFQHWLYDDPAERAMSDVDVLVRSDQARVAYAILQRAGYRPMGRSRIGAFVMRSPFGLALDLHSQLFDRTRYKLPTADVFSRSSPDRALFGALVRLPSPLDAYAHLIGKFGSDHLNAGSKERLDEIARMPGRIEASPDIVARHLVHCGMRRVARYVLPLVSETVGDPFAARVLGHLPRDPVGETVASIARPVLAHAGPYSRIGAITAHLLNDSLPRGLRSGVRSLVAHSR
ncbi:MAG: nucleotidyltransferase family protein [Myxococcales bacterium]|nr:nucleotidyltransferase family protein [Myxococcales bacterium]